MQHHCLLYMSCHNDSQETPKSVHFCRFSVSLRITIHKMITSKTVTGTLSSNLIKYFFHQNKVANWSKHMSILFRSINYPTDLVFLYLSLIYRVVIKKKHATFCFQSKICSFQYFLKISSPYCSWISGNFTL